MVWCEIMIFAHTLQQVLCGEKSQTRRLVKQEECFDASLGRVVRAGKRTVYKIGKSYSVQPNRGKKGVARIELVNLRKEPVSAITHADALAEGFASRDEFLATWRSIHGQNADLSHEVWVLEFRLHAIVADEIKVLYEQRRATYRSAYYSNDLSTSIEGVSGIGLHSGHYKNE